MDGQKRSAHPSEGTHLESTEKVLMLENAPSTHGLCVLMDFAYSWALRTHQ